MIPVVCPAYLPNIYYCSWILNQTKVLFIVDSHYQKQTFRNRCEIYGANGKLKLTIPVVHTKTKAPLKEKEVCISNETPWRKQHWKSICSAYRSSPYFEFYETELAPFFEKKETHLMQFNIQILIKIMELIEAPFSYELVEWNKNKHQRMDSLINAKKNIDWKALPYTQVFQNKNGFLNNLSLLDVIFNLGPESFTYLKNQKGITP